MCKPGVCICVRVCKNHKKHAKDIRYPNNPYNFEFQFEFPKFN